MTLAPPQVAAFAAAWPPGAALARLKARRAAGIIDDRQIALKDNLVLFDAERAACVLLKSANALSLLAAGKYLNAPRKQTRLVRDFGLGLPTHCRRRS